MMIKIATLITMFCTMFSTSTTLSTIQPYGCECMKLPGTNQCLKYDNRLQAQNIEEAMSFFEDLSLLEDPKPTEKVRNQQALKCETEQCKVCRKLLKQKLNSVGLFVGFVDMLSGGNISQTCEKYRFARPNSDTVPIEKLKEDKDDSSNSDSEEMEEAAENFKNMKDQLNESKTSLKSFFNGFFGRKKREIKYKQIVDERVESSDESDQSEETELLRRKRQSVDQSENLIGERFYLSCTEKGTQVDGSGFLSLCSKCWAWRKLPENYWPQYVNELVCVSNDTTCLSGYGTCGSGTQQLDVLKNVSGVFETVSLSASTYCECQIKAGSTLEPLIYGRPNSAPVSGLPPANSEVALPP
ncbi:hypothetical protein M3Y98_00406600 [Aphelenchoides besseyi]|nr:hypothetical protein M3Y98_00406600 [Aphelenchoides besseyi]KAI6201997.1 hypothetical protein M3Y96_00901600 [Aphelenchoides besseyi]